jgi:PAS domain S-box-containing protein
LVTSLKLLVAESLGRDAPFFLYPLALIATGWFGTARSAALATILSVLAGWYFFLRPYEPFGISYVVRLGALSFEGIAISAFVARLRRAQAQLLDDIGKREQTEKERKSAQHAAEDAARRVLRLQTLTVALAAARTPLEIANVIASLGVDALGADAGLVAQPVAGARLSIIAQQGMSMTRVERFQTHAIDGQLPSSVTFRTRKPQWVEDSVELGARFPDLAESGTDISALAALPLIVEERTLGVMAFGFRSARVFSSDERALLESFASQAAQALERALLYSQEVALRERLESIAKLTSRLSTAMTREEVSTVVVALGMAAASADTCTLYVLEQSGSGLELLAHRGIAPGILQRLLRLPPDPANPTFRMLVTGEAVWAENESEYLSLYPELASLRVEGPRARAFWCLPLIAEGKPFGVLGMGYYAPRHFGAEERAFVQTFTRHCAEALRRAQRLEAEGAARNAAEKLQASLATTLHSIGDAVIATDMSGRVTLMNAVAEKLTGFSESDALGKPLTEVFHIVNEQTRQEVESPIEKVLREGTVIGLANHTVLLARDGRETPIDDSGAPIRAADGNLEGVVLVFRDVTQKKREQARRDFLAEATAALSESLDYEVTLSRVAELAVPKLGDWCAVDIVEAGQRRSRQLAVAHVDPSKVELARELGRRYPPNPDAATGVPSVLRSGKSELYREIPDEILRAGARDEEHLRIARELGLVSAMVVPLLARGQVLGAMTLISTDSQRRYSDEDLHFAEDLARRCAFAVDNARLYAAEQRARNTADVANRAKDQFLATVSHELRTPLNAIMGWAKMMSSANLDEPKRKRAVETIERNAVAMAQLIEDLLDVSRIISGKMRLEVQEVDASRIVEAAIESVKPAADARGIQLVVKTTPEPMSLLADPSRLQQVVWNLLTNAVKFTPNGGRVEIDIQRRALDIEIHITDTGAGIDPKFLPYVFDAFRQERDHDRHVRARGGLGLGLAITRQLVELHGGRIEAHSRGEGHGATFIVRLPASGMLHRSEPSFQRGSRQIRIQGDFERPTHLRGLRVLVVDDDEDARQLVHAVLEECGSTVFTRDSVDAAIEVLEHEKLDVLISDIGMPGQDGYDLIRRVRSLPASRGGTIPAAALTAFARGEDRRRALNAGYAMHIPKPVEPAELVSVVASLSRSILGGPEAQGAARQ